MHAALLVAEPFRAQLPGAVKVPVLGQEAIDPVFAAERYGLGVEHQISNCVPLSGGFGEGPGHRTIALGEASSRVNASDASSAECGGLKSLGWIRTRRNSARQNTGNGPASLRIGTCCQPCAGGPVQWQFRRVGVHENIGVDGDRSRSSISSNRASRSSAVMPGTSCPCLISSCIRKSPLPESAVGRWSHKAFSISLVRVRPVSVARTSAARRILSSRFRVVLIRPSASHAPESWKVVIGTLM